MSAGNEDEESLDYEDEPGQETDSPCTELGQSSDAAAAEAEAQEAAAAAAAQETAAAAAAKAARSAQASKPKYVPARKPVLSYTGPPVAEYVPHVAEQVVGLTQYLETQRRRLQQAQIASDAIPETDLKGRQQFLAEEEPLSKHPIRFVLTFLLRKVAAPGGCMQQQLLQLLDNKKGPMHGSSTAAQFCCNHGHNVSHTSFTWATTALGRCWRTQMCC